MARTKDKITRASEAQPAVEQGKLRLRCRPDGGLEPSMQPIRDEMIAFPAAEHDDTVDGVVDLLEHARSRRYDPQSKPATVKDSRERLWRIYGTAPMSDQSKQAAADTQGGDQMHPAPVWQADASRLSRCRALVLPERQQDSAAGQRSRSGHDRNLQRQMRYDPDIMGPLLMLQLSVACSGVGVQTPADFMRGRGFGRSRPRSSRRSLKSTPRLTDLMRHLLDALWYGRPAVNMVFGKTDEVVYIRDWLPIHGDSLTMTELGQLGLKVGPRYYTQTIGGSGPRHRQDQRHGDRMG
jgi:hypothetical protein